MRYEHYTFCVEDARRYGINEAIVLKLLEVVESALAEERDGRNWVRMSAQDAANYLTFMTATQTRRALKSLESQGVIACKYFHTESRAFSYSINQLTDKDESNRLDSQK